jgi:hypothetical protein
MLFGTAVAVLLAAPAAFAQPAGAPSEPQAAPSGASLPWNAAKRQGAGDVGAKRGFYDYMARAASGGSSVPFIGEMAEENAESAPFMGRTAGSETVAMTEGATAESGSSTPPEKGAAAGAGNGEPLSTMALAKAALGWDEVPQRQAASKETRR